MTGGAGHALDAINKLRQNRFLRKSNRTKYGENIKEGVHTADENIKMSFSKVPKDTLSKVKSDIRKQALKERRKEIVISLSVIILIITLVLLLVL